MEKIQHVLTTVIAFVAVLTVLSVIFNWLLNPVKENQASLQANQVRLEKRMDKLEVEVKGISTKLDQLISQNSKK